MTAPISSAAMTGPEATAAEQSRMELQARLNGLGGLNGRQLDPQAKAKKLREACEGFESIFIQKMWQEMRNAIPKTGLLTGREERFWQDMYDQELSKSMTKAGGIGLADMMYEQLSRNLVSASRSSATGAMAGAFTPGAAPLVPEKEATDKIAPPVAASVYETEAPQVPAAALAQNAQPEPARSGQVEQTPQVAPAVTAAMEQTQAPQAKAASVAAIYNAAASNRKPQKSHIHAADLGQSSALLNAQRAKREAGDKLGPRAVRPAASHARREVESGQQAPAAAPATGVMQAGNLAPGSAEAIRAAVEMAKTGQTIQPEGEAPNLTALVANVTAKNAVEAQLAANDAQQPAQTAPVTKKVRRSTNIPQRNNNNKVTRQKPAQAIRTLNVDNVGVNSKAGQGLKAYQAQRDAQQAEAAMGQPAGMETAAAQPAAPLAPAAPEADGAIPPLTAKDTGAAAEQDSGAFAIPPLTASAARS